MRIIKTNFIGYLKLSIVFALVIGFIFTNIPLFAAAETKVYDFANLFSLDQIESLESSTAQLAETYQMDIGIVTTDDAEGKSAQDYADDFYDNNGYGYGNNLDGLLFLIDMDNREVYISTCGSGIQYFTDSRISKMLDSAINDVSKEDYFAAATHFLDNVKTNMDKGIPSNQYSTDRAFSDSRANYNDYTPQHKPFTSSSGGPLDVRSIGLSAIVALLGAAIIAFIVRSIVQYTYKHPRFTTPQTKPDDLSVHYTEREDHFVTSHTTRVKIETDNGASGRSSTHQSSGGSSHGGGGRGF